MAVQIDHIELRDLITVHYNDSELRTLCFDLNVDYDTLAGEEKSAKVRELISFLHRRNRLTELTNTIARNRPDITLSNLISDEVSATSSTLPSPTPIHSNDSVRELKNNNGLDQPLPPLT